MRAGIVYGLYLTLSSWVLFYVATHMTFFHDSCHLEDLNTTPGNLQAYCSVRPLLLSTQPPNMMLKSLLVGASTGPFFVRSC